MLQPRLQFRHLFLVLLCILFAIGCGQKSPMEEIAMLEAQFIELTADQDVSPQSQEVKQLIQQLSDRYIQVAQSPSPAEEAPTYYFKAASYHETYLAQPEKAIWLYEELRSKYPSHDLSADALFKVGYIYHNMIRDLPKAKVAYQAFIDQYPEHQLIPHAKFEIENLGVDPSDILSRIQNQRDTTLSAGK